MIINWISFIPIRSNALISSTKTYILVKFEISLPIFTESFDERFPPFIAARSDLWDITYTRKDKKKKIIIHEIYIYILNGSNIVPNYLKICITVGEMYISTWSLSHECNATRCICGWCASLRFRRAFKRTEKSQSSDTYPINGSFPAISSRSELIWKIEGFDKDQK